MRARIGTVVGISLFSCCWHAPAFGDDKAEPTGRKRPEALATGKNGAIVGTTGPAAVHAGLEVLKSGGSAADAAVATSLAQVVECGGAYVSHAGIFAMVYFDAATGKVHFLNACYNTVLEEKDPLSIPGRGKPSGRSAPVPGFMAGVQAAHDRFGKLPRARVFEPAIEMAGKGQRVSPMLGRFLTSRQAVLSRLPETKKIFTKDDGTWYAEGELFRQPELAETLRQVSEHGADYMYTGDWAKKFVAAVQKEGGKMTLADMQAYKVIWEEPLETTHRGHQVLVPGYSSHGGISLIEALHLLEQAELPLGEHFTTRPESLFWLMQISHCHVLDYLPETTLRAFQGLDLTPKSRVKRETAAAIWKQMRDGKWPFASHLSAEENGRPAHSDGVVAVDRWGNVAAVTHSINTVLWGDTGLFVGGVSVPDSASFQQAAIKRTGPGKRLADPMCPLIVLRDGKPVLGSSAIGGGLHQRTLQVLASVLDYGMEAQSAVEMPAFMLPDFTGGKPMPQVEIDQFERTVLNSVNKLGQKTKELSMQEAGAFRGYWVGVQIDPKDGTRRATGTRKAPIPSVAEGY